MIAPFVAAVEPVDDLRGHPPVSPDRAAAASLGTAGAGDLAKTAGPWH